MQKPVLIAQLSDLHIGSDWEGVDPVPGLERVIAAVGRLPNRVDGVVVTGDVAGDGRDEEYEIARELLGRFDVPVHVLPGNHDDRAGLRGAFELPGDGDEPIDYAVEVRGVRILMLDSPVPGQDPGKLEAAQLDWLDRQLAEHPEAPTLLAMHHSPLPTGIDEWDEVNLVAEQRRALGEVVGRHGHLKAIVAGHLHRVAASVLGGTPVLSGPSTYLQSLPDFVTEGVAWNGEPPAFALHALHRGELSSQVESVAG
ncbi:MAG TPA: phosphodiesterase [Solirubrobacterales bacterium]|nr:phosphodiesterase [Solirubrobacterales bacterium]